MTRISKKAKRRAISPRKCRPPQYNQTGPLKDNLPNGFREHPNALADTAAAEQVFIGKIR